MKSLIFFALFIALAPRACQDEKDEDMEEETTDQVGYVAEDIKIRKAIADYEKFLEQADSTVHAAKVQIRMATDKLESRDTKHRLILRGEILKAEQQLEFLSEKLLRGQAMLEKGHDFDDDALTRMKEFKEDFKRKKDHLDKTLEKLKNTEYH